MTKQKPPYSIEIVGDLIVVSRFGPQTAETVTAIRYELNSILNRKDSPKDVLVLVKNASKLHNAASMFESIQSINILPYRRLAIVGTIPERLEVAKQILKASKVTDRVKIFRSENDARAWLTNPD